MKKFFLLGVLLMGAVPVFSSDSNNVKENIVTEDADIKAYRATNFNGTPNDTSDDAHAYFNTSECRAAFLLLHPEYEENGKETVPETQVFTCI